MSPSLPKRLENPPLIESVFELRFEPSQERAADLLPGVFFAKLPSFTKLLESLPVSAIPRAVRDADPNMRFLPSHRLSGDNRFLMFGDRVLAFSQITPYPGWEKVKTGIEEALKVMKGTGFAKRVERYSLKAVNLLPVPAGKQLQTLSARFEVAGRPAEEQGFHLSNRICREELAHDCRYSGAGDLSSTRRREVWTLDSARYDQDLRFRADLE